MAKKKKNPTRLILIIVVLLVVVLAGVMALGGGSFGNDETGLQVETAKVERRTITQTVTASGRIQPEVEVNISPDVSGEIIFLGVNEGDWVERNTLLVRIKADFYEAQVEQSKASVSQTRAGLAQARAQMLKAELDYNREKELFDKGVVPEANLQSAKTSYEVAQASYESAEFQVESAAARLREAEEQLSKTRIYAPMSGTISQLNIELGERVVGTAQMQGTEIMRLARLDQMEMEVDVNENDVVNVALQDSAAIEVDAYPDRIFKGIVTEIANSARTTGMGTQEQITNFPVKIRIVSIHNVEDGTTGSVIADPETNAQPTPQFRPGMSGTVDIFTHTVNDVLAVPIQSVTVRDVNRMNARGGEASSDEQPVTNAADVEEDLQKVVFLTGDDGKAHMKVVETGISDDSYIQVTSGLDVDETVVTGPYSAVSRTLRPDMAVRTNDGNERARATNTETETN